LCSDLLNAGSEKGDFELLSLCAVLHIAGFHAFRRVTADRAVSLGC
jgi:hypothetical protein